MAFDYYVTTIKPGETVKYKNEKYIVDALIVTDYGMKYRLTDDRGANIIVNNKDDLEIYREYDINEVDVMYDYQDFEEGYNGVYDKESVKEIIINELDEEGFEKLLSIPPLFNERCGDLIDKFYLQISRDPEWLGRKVEVKITILKENSHTYVTRVKWIVEDLLELDDYNIEVRVRR